MIIIGISGLIGSGKDTVANLLTEEYGFIQDSFAASLKDAVSAIFGWDREMLEGKTPEARIKREKIDTWWANRLGFPKLSPRWAMQHFGTELCKKKFHSAIWIASMENRLQHATQPVVVSDVRFADEIAMLRSINAITIRVSRGPNPPWYDTAIAANSGDNDALTYMQVQSNIHPSEWEWIGSPVDYEIDNNGTIVQLRDKIRSLLAEKKVSRVSNYE